MTATEILVSSRLMKTDDSLKEAVKRNKKQEEEQTKNTKRTKTQNASQEKNTTVIRLSNGSNSSSIPHCFSTVISSQAPSTLLLLPYSAYTPPLFFTLSQQ